MNQPDLCFLGWEKPAIELVTERLLCWARREPETFRRAVVVVPTAESGRRLREHVAEKAGHALLMPRVILMGALVSARGVPAPMDEAAAWLAVLGQEESLEKWPHVFCWPADGRSIGELGPGVLQDLILSRVVELMHLRTQLDVADVIPDDVCRCLREMEASWGEGISGEIERWEEVKELVNRVEAYFHAWGMQTVRETVDAALQSPPGGGRVVLACVPQVSPLARRYLRHLVKGGAGVEIWIHAPEEQRRFLDEFGCPMDRPGDEDAWSRCPIPLPEKAVHVVGHSSAMAAEVLRLLQGYAPEEVALGVCDARFAPTLAVALERKGWRLWLPARRTAAATDVGRLPALLQNALLSSGGDAASLSALLRNGAMQVAYGVEDEESWKVGTLLDEVEQNDYPDQAEALMDSLCRRGGLPYAEEVWKLLQRLAQRKTFPKALEELSGRLFATAGEGALGRLQRELARWMYSWVDRIATGDRIFRFDLVWPLLQKLTCGGTVDDDAREETHLDALGWMELPYTDSRLVVLTGLHERCVPEAAAQDPFLPESLRRRLGMDYVGLRVARDSFLLSGLMHAHPGMLHVVVARQADDKSLVMPSRLLMRFGMGQEKELARRVRHLLEHPEDSRFSPEYERGNWFMGAGARDWLGTAAQEDISLIAPGVENPWGKGKREFSPSVIGSFLRNPLAFWIRHLLGLDPRKVYQEKKSSLDVLDFGTVAHSVLFRLVQQYPRWRVGVTVDDMSRFVKAVLDEEFGLRTTLSLRIQRELLERQMLQFVRLHQQDLEAGWCTDESRGLEVEVHWELEGEIPLSMRLDRVDEHAHSGMVRVIDYKTSDRIPEQVHLEKLSPESVALFRRFLPQLKLLRIGDAWYRWKDVQLPLYVRYVREQYPGRPLQLGYCLLPKTHSPVHWEMWDLPAEWEENALLWCREAVKLIREGRCLLAASDLALDSRDDFGCLDVENSLRCMLNLPPVRELIERRGDESQCS